MKKSWDKKWYSDEFLQKLKATERISMDGDLEITENMRLMPFPISALNLACLEVH